MARVKSGGYISPNSPAAIPGATENPVAVASDRQKWLEGRRKLPRDLMGGTDAMRAAGRLYAKQHPAEEDDSYTLRINSTTLYGAFSKTVVRQAGKLFSKQVTLVDADQVMAEFSNDVDGEGRSITAFANDAVKDGFVDGISYLMVDFPSVPAGATQADVNLMRARPYWVLIPAARVLDWRSENLGGQQTLMQFRFREEVEERIDEFTVQIVEQIRVLDFGGFYRVYRKVKDVTGQEDWRLVQKGSATWVFVPVVPVYVNRCGFFEGLPPLRELAELNAEHWVSSSEQRRALSFQRFAMLALIGRTASKTAKPVEIGPDKVLDLPAGGDAKYIEHSGAGIGAGLADLDAIEKRMQTAGMEIRIENAGQVTATAAAIDSAEGNAALKAVAKGVEGALNTALLITGAFLRVAKVGIAKIDDEFAETPNGDANQFIALYGAGLASRETVWDELVRRHVLDDDFDPELEAARIANEQMTLAQLAAASAPEQQLPPGNAEAVAAAQTEGG